MSTIGLEQTVYKKPAFPYTSTGTWSYYAHAYLPFNICKMNGSWNFVIIIKLKRFHMQRFMFIRTPRIVLDSRSSARALV
jgi:hypothetical protein